MLLPTLAACAQATAAPIASTSAPGLPTGTPSPAHVQSYVQATQRIATLRVLGQERATQSMATVMAMSHLPTATPDPTSEAEYLAYKRELAATAAAFEQWKQAVPGMCAAATTWDLSTSAGHTWVKVNCQKEEELRFSNPETSQIWSFPYEEFFSPSDLTSEYYTPYNVSFFVRHWTKDGRYVYFEPDYCCWDPFILFLGNYVEDLNVLDLQTGRWKQVFDRLSYLSFSPTDRRMVFVNLLSSPLYMNIRDLRTGVTTTLRLPLDDKYEQAGNIVWSPNGLKFAVLAAYGYEFGTESQQPGVFSIMSVDLADPDEPVLTTQLSDSLAWIEIESLTDDGILAYSAGPYSTPDFWGNIPMVSVTPVFIDLKNNSRVTPTPEITAQYP
jgi:hypothetical protein